MWNPQQIIRNSYVKTKNMRNTCGTLTHALNIAKIDLVRAAGGRTKPSDFQGNASRLRVW